MTDLIKMKHMETQYEVKAEVRKSIIEKLTRQFPGCSVTVGVAQMTTDILDPFAVQLKLTYTVQITPKDPETIKETPDT